MTSEPDPEAAIRRYHADFWRAPAAIAAIGLDSVMLSCNAAFAEILGVEPCDLIGKNTETFVIPDEVDQAVSESLTRMEDERTRDNRPTPIRLLRADGTPVWVQFDSVLVDDAPEPYVLATITDVSTQVESQQALDRSDMWFRALLQHQSDIVTVVGFDALVHYISPNCERLLGFAADELIGTSALDNIHPDDVDVLIGGMDAQLSDATAAEPVQYRQRRKDGSWAWLEAIGRQLPELGVEAVIVNARDVSERRRAEKAAREAEARFRDAFASSPLGIAFTDLHGRFTWVNRSFSTMVDTPEDEMLGMSLLDFSNGLDMDEERNEFRRLLRGEIESFCSERLYEQPGGPSMWSRLHFSLVRDAGGEPTQLLCQLEDITERKHREMILTHDASHDPLTGLLNRSGLREHVDLAWSTRSNETPVAVLFGDLDGFKHVNDTLGHDAGDEVLAHVAQRLRTAVRSGDVVARWGGDEFVVLCPTVAGVDDATQIADRIRVALEAPFRVGPGLAEIGISVGVAIDTGQPLPDLLIKDADSASYRAKVMGRNRVVVA